MKSVYFETNGCAVQRHETYKMAKYFELNGWEELTTPQDADIIIFTTCAVVDTLEKNALAAIRRLYDIKKSGSLFVVAGCLPSINLQAIREISSDIICLKNGEGSKLDSMIDALTSFESVHYNADPKRHHSYGDPGIVADPEVDQDEQLCMQLSNLSGNDKIFETFCYLTRGRHLWKEDDLFEVRVSYGCSHKCSYCITRKAIGDFQSVPLETVINQIENGVNKNYSKFMLMGDEIGSYGEDFGASIVELIKKIHDNFPDIRVGIRYIHPDSMVKYYEQLKPYFEEGLIYYFCSAFQSGSPKILKQMYRNPILEPFLSCMEDIDSNGYPVYKHTQIIVGFPGETPDDLRATEDALRKGGFDYALITPFSIRRGTPAASFDNQISEEVKLSRCDQIEKYMKCNRKIRLYERIRMIMLK